MTSLVAEALSGAKRLERDSLEQRVEKLQLHLSESKAELLHLVQEQYSEFLPSAIAFSRELSAKSDELKGEVESEMTLLRRELAVDEAAGEGKTAGLRDELAEVEAVLSSLSGVRELAEGVEELQFLQPASQPLATARLIVQLEAKLSSLESGDGGNSELVDARVLTALREELIIHREGAIYALLQWWKTTFQTEAEGADAQLAIAAGTAPGERLGALRLLGYADGKLEQLADWLLAHFFHPLGDWETELAEESGSTELGGPTQRCLRLSKTKKRESGAAAIKKAAAVLEAMGKTSGRLESLLGELRFPAVGETAEESLLSALGVFLGPGLQELVLGGCLKPAVPSEASESAAFEGLLAQAEKGEAMLRGMGLLRGDSEALTAFRADKESLLIDRRCQAILAKGRELILSERPNLVEVGEAQPSNSDPLELLDAQAPEGLSGSVGRAANEVEGVALEAAGRLPAVLRFPRCSVSESVVELLGLVESTLAEAAGSGNGRVAGRLTFTARSLLELFVDIAPGHHAASFQSMPIFAAAFYNNCYFLAHRLLSLGWEVSPKLGPLLGHSAGSLSVSFVDLIPRLRAAASEALEAQMGARQTVLSELVSGSGGFAAVVDERRQERMEKALRGCCLQLEQVARVWKGVMTTCVYAKALGRLTTALLKAVTGPILALEDIPAPDSDFLAEQMEAVSGRVDALFDLGSGSQAAIFCGAPYYRFKEIGLCLAGSLQSISDRWAAGAGPLAVHLTPSELKSLVKALFQNTERRAAFLASMQ